MAKALLLMVAPSLAGPHLPGTHTDNSLFGQTEWKSLGNPQNYQEAVLSQGAWCNITPPCARRLFIRYLCRSGSHPVELSLLHRAETSKVGYKMDSLASATLLKADGSTVDATTALQGKVKQHKKYMHLKLYPL